MDRSDSNEDDVRALPFVVKVAAEWLNFDDAAEIDDGAFFFRDRTRLTGVLVNTADGADVNFSDIGLYG
jgi:hypothetical protein